MAPIVQEIKFYLTIEQLVNILTNTPGTISGFFLNLAVDDDAKIWITVTAAESSDGILLLSGPTEGAIPTPPGAHGTERDINNTPKITAFLKALSDLKNHP